MTNEEVLERFALEYQAYNNISPDRCKVQLRILRRFADSLDGDLLAASGPDLYAWASREIKRGIHINTVRKFLNMIRPFYSWAFDNHLITADQYVRIQRVKNPRGSTGMAVPRPYSDEEMAAFWLALDARYPRAPTEGDRSRAIDRWLRGVGPFGRASRFVTRMQLDAQIGLALDCGLRVNEIHTIPMLHLHYDNAFLVVAGKRDANTGKPRYREIPFPEHTRETIKTWIEFRALIAPDHEHPWLSLWGQQCREPMSRERLGEALKPIGPGWRWHRFRHTCGTNWLRAGMDPVYVKELLGHSSLNMTLGYMKITKNDLEVQMAKHQEGFNEHSRRAA